MWDDAFPSFLIGLREGLEAGLIVSVLVATLVRADAKSRLPQVWTGVLAAIALSMSFGAVLTFTAASLSTAVQEAFGGALSLVAVAFVTAMVFWMRRSARSLAGEIKEKVTEALTMGAGVLVLTSFLAVGREGLETALFLWTTARAADESAGPLTGAGIGLVLAAVLCWGLYRRVLSINLTRFFTATGAVLIVIAAGVLGYGLRDLQEGGVLPGGTAYAVDLSGSVDAGSWYSTLLQGVLNLTPTMTWLQVVGYVGYLGVVMPLFVRGVRGVAPVASATPALPVQGTPPLPTPTRPHPAWLIPVAVVAVPVVLAGLVVVLARPEPAGGETVAVSAKDCGQGFTAPEPGRQTFQMRNTGDQTSEVYLIDPATNAVYGEIEGLAPGTTRDLVATVAGGTYAWRCVPSDGKAVTSKAVRVGGAAGAGAVVPVSEQDLAGPLRAYKTYVNRGLATLVTQTRKLGDDVRAGHLGAARADWLTAHRTYASLGAAYGTFEDFDQKINGRPDGLPGGVHDKRFTGFQRIEYGLWHGQSAGELEGLARQLTDDTAGLRKAFPRQDFDASDLPLRAHEILENTLQFELTGDTDQGSGTGLATADANLSGTRELLTVLRPLLTTRAPRLLPTVDADIARLQALLDAEHRDGRWTPVDRLGRTAKARIDGAAGQLLEDLSPVPDLLEVRKSA
ncbi:iron uptake transporter permease EfeU [Streptomyces coeruleorubidus]|uniref:Iron uptake transporter permease EfeU n=1 Tax=Streptomyces coeruleorubidus TaxID=116188 RepID=A0ABZ0KLL8_STRC4|nr:MULTISPECIES: iron uptake transporter permease EfeU [Streptomyces]WOT38732.1 iron uptake transporter permease EfeU [Streptomyces coeruleorubidus]GGT96359.1 putative iron permease FTR1 [Streptomyces bellus]